MDIANDSVEALFALLDQAQDLATDLSLTDVLLGLDFARDQLIDHQTGRPASTLSTGEIAADDVGADSEHGRDQ